MCEREREHPHRSTQNVTMLYVAKHSPGKTPNFRDSQKKVTFEFRPFCDHYEERFQFLAGTDAAQRGLTRSTPLIGIE